MQLTSKCAKSLAGFIFLLTCSAAHADPCTYDTWDWNSIQKKSVNHRKITKLKSELTKEEIGETKNCSVCEEDQAVIQFESVPAFKVCKQMEEKITRALKKAKLKGFPITSVVGYRVGKSKRALNSLGQRTQFSNHSFGTAIDINSEKNGLYDFCVQFGPQCKLLRGGAYEKQALGSISEQSAIYKALIDEGFKWGGEIKGKQKDFMHFSLSGM